jgi:MarR family
MDEALVAQVRRFNRVVTQHVGALNERYLARDHSLGEARVLWEIGPEGSDVRSLRVRLGLDSGYLSRLLARLTTAGLVTLGQSGSDGRLRIARLPLEVSPSARCSMSAAMRSPGRCSDRWHRANAIGSVPRWRMSSA